MLPGLGGMVARLRRPRKPATSMAPPTTAAFSLVARGDKVGWSPRAREAGMSTTSETSYTVEHREMVAETPELRMVVLTLAAGQEVPWHWHSNVSDHMICLEGPMVVEMRAPREQIELDAGERCTVPMRRAHRVSGKAGGRCKFAILQGVGAYDFNPVGG
jgi:quercetin dioxygenase-like cupin family protein